LSPRSAGVRIGHAVFVPLLVALATASTVSAQIAFSGSETSGTIAPNNLVWSLVSNDQTVSGSFRGFSVFGLPGLGAGDVTWPSGVGMLQSFTITFTDLPSGVSIDQTPESDPHSYDDNTRMQAGAAYFTRSFSGSNTVTFAAPAGSNLSAGTPFFLNIAFTGGAVTTVQFSGNWNSHTVTSVPTLSTWGLALCSLLLMGLALWKLPRLSEDVNPS
jgi:hypothetical protein